MLVQAAAAAAGGQQYPAPALYVVATPIGNLADLTLRALHVLAPGRRDRLRGHPPQRRAAAPLRRSPSRCSPLHEHNEREAAGAVLARLGRGERVAYVSDAGTPAVSDPGAALVAAARAAGYRVVPIPGASSALAALVGGRRRRLERASPFVGFLPARGGERAPAPLAALAARARRRRCCSRRRTASRRSPTALGRGVPASGR